MVQLARIPMALLLLSFLSGGALSAQALPKPLVSCPFSGTANGNSSSGLYVASYPGNNLSHVTLGYRGSVAQRYGVTLTAHRTTFDGPVIGTPQTQTVNLPATGELLVTFDFGGAPVTPGDTIAFVQSFTIEGEFGALTYLDEGPAPCSGVTETVNIYPPITLVPNGGAGITITQKDLTRQSCIPSDTVLCVDNLPGDQRFQVTASYHTAQAGGLSGTAQAVPLAPLGTNHGGVFWFFSPDNPEMLVKVLNGCANTDHFWVYISAGTNVAYTITVEDTFRANIAKTYTNPDLKPAVPIQDTLALASCHDCAVDSDCRTGLRCCPLPIQTRACLPPGPTGECIPYP